MTITDEMVEKAAKAIIERYTKVSDAPLHTESRMRMAMPDARAALEAVAPALIAQGILWAAKEVEWNCTRGVVDALRYHAQELDPQ